MREVGDVRDRDKDWTGLTQDISTLSLTMMETRLQLLLFLSLALVSLTSGSGVGEEFQRFKAEHGKSYSSAKEESHRSAL